MKKQYIEITLPDWLVRMMETWKWKILPFFSRFLNRMFFPMRTRRMKSLGYELDIYGFYERTAYEEGDVRIRLYAKTFKGEVVLIAERKGGRKEAGPIISTELHDIIFYSPIKWNECDDVDAVAVKKPWFKSFSETVKDMEVNCLSELTELPNDKLFSSLSSRVRDEVAKGTRKELKERFIRY